MTIRPVGGKFPEPWRKSDEYFYTYKDFFPLPTDYRRAAAGDAYDVGGAMQFNLMTSLGLREHHYLLDIGCGSLRAGRFFIPYLLPGRYYGIDPMEWMVEAGIECEVGEDLIRIKRPTLSNDDQLNLTVFKQDFDFILAQSVLTHFTRPMLDKCLEEAAAVMRKPMSIFAASVVLGDEDCKFTEWTMVHAGHYTWDTLDAVARANGLVCRRINWPHTDNQLWVIFACPEFEGEAVRRAAEPCGFMRYPIR